MRTTSRILLNVLPNAIRFRASGRSVKIGTGTGDAGDFFITIRDAGIGMTKEAMLNPFTPFHQVDATTSRRFGGTGLGLAIIRRLIELQGGSVDLSSGENVGTQVIPRFPATRLGPVSAEMPGFVL